MMKFMKTPGKPEKMNVPYVKNYVLSTAFCYARYTMGMEELTNFGMNNS